MKHVQITATPHGKRPQESSAREKATRFVSRVDSFLKMGTNDVLVLLEPLSGFQDRTFREECEGKSKSREPGILGRILDKSRNSIVCLVERKLAMLRIL